MSIEVEQKFRVLDVAALELQLASLGAEQRGTLVQVDCYYAHPQRSFAHTDEALRIRRVGPLNYITYKGPKLDAVTKTRREIEIELPRGQQAATDAGQLLEALGFTRVAHVRKRRVEYVVPWQQTQVSVLLDDVQGVGDFVELEIMTATDGVDAARDTIASLARKLDLSNNERRSYLELLLGGRAEP